MRLCWMLLAIAPFLYSVDADEEALFLRRIADFWQEGEYQIAKGQIEEYISTYPESPYIDPLCAALGDLFIREKNFSGALDAYSQIQTPEFSQRVFLNRMQCLYELQWYATLSDECEVYLEKGPNIHATYFLAIALYHQCLNASKNPEQLQALAQRASPHFETLAKSELSNEVAQAYAHLCCIQKNYSKACEITLDLAEKDPEAREEMLFQAALIQSEFDKSQALQTFDQIVKLGQKRAKEAAYNRLVLSFELGQYENLSQENLLNEIPAEYMSMGHLFLGRSLIHLQKYSAAIQEIKQAIQEMPVSDTFHGALLALLDACYQASDLPSLEGAIQKLVTHYPEDPELPKAYFSRAQLLKKTENFSAAQEQLEQILTAFPECQQKPQIVFELAHLDYKAKEWVTCYEKARDFLAQFPEHELVPFAWRYALSAAAEISRESASFQPQLIADLKTFLDQPLAESEKAEWALLLAKTYYEQKEYEPAIQCLENVKTPNGILLLALCYRDGHQDQKQFCHLAETALSQGADLVNLKDLHTALFNAYVELSQSDQGAEHLYAALEAKADIKIENLLWLSENYLHKLEENPTDFLLAHRTAGILEKCKKMLPQGEKDAILCKLAKVYSLLGRTDEEISVLEAIPSPSPEAQLLLAESYARKGVTEKATQMFDALVTAMGTTRNPISASASLQALRLKKKSANPDLVQIATQLKNLTLQKNLAGEPVYLEAALDYVDLQAHADNRKKITLLQKIKRDFEQTEDLLSKDYHEARAQSPYKNKLYQGYLQLMDAEIFAAQARLEPINSADLTLKSKNLLFQIVNEQSAPALLQRARMLLTNIDEPKAKT